MRLANNNTAQDGGYMQTDGALDGLARVAECHVALVARRVEQPAARIVDQVEPLAAHDQLQTVTLIARDEDVVLLVVLD